MNWLILSSLMLTVFITNSSALKCYICSTSEDGSDTSCATDIKTATKLNCDRKYCKITRVEYKDPKGYLSSFIRTCDDKYENSVTEDDVHRIYISSCKTPLCNTGDGKNTNGDNNNDGNFGDKSPFYTRGIGNGAFGGLKGCSLILFVSILVVTIFG